MKLNKNSVTSLAVVFFMIAITAAIPTTTFEMRTVSEMVRIFALLILITSILIFLSKFRLNVSSFLSIFAFIFFFSYGMALASIYGGFSTAIKIIPQSIIIISIGLIVFSQRNTIIGITEAKILVAYVLIFFILIYLFGGFFMGYPPHFIFDHQTQNYGSTVKYGQGVTKFFGIGAVLCAYCMSKEDNSFSRWPLFFLTIILLILSLLGGARGDSLAAAIVIYLIFLAKHPIRSIAFLVAFIVISISIFSTLSLTEDFIVFRRFQSLFDNQFIGIRQYLYLDAIKLLETNPRCLIFGCGFDYYQSYYGFSSGMYPHNFILEFLIVFGLPLSVMLFASSSLGILVTYYRYRELDGFFIIFFYYTIIYFKSGSIVSGWLFILGLFYYFGIGLEFL